MKRSLLLVVPLVLAACGGGGSTDPDELVDSLDSPRFYIGPATSIRRTTTSVLDDTLSIIADVRFGTSDRGAPPVGYRMVSGTMRVEHTANVGPCTYSGGTTAELREGDGVIMILPGSRYEGYIRKEVSFSTAVRCPTGGASIEDTASLDLRIEGSLINGRMVGTIPPLTAANSTFTGSWNFTPVVND